MPTYFGNQTTTGNQWDSGDAGYMMAINATCPGSGNMSIIALEVYAKGTGNVRLAIFSNDKLTKIAEGASKVAVSGEGWWGHSSVSGILVGGINYWLCVSFDNNSTLPHYETGTSYYQGSSDYTDGYPSSITIVNSLSVGFTIRCGVDQTSSGLALPIAQNYYNNMRH